MIETRTVEAFITFNVAYFTIIICKLCYIVHRLRNMHYNNVIDMYGIQISRTVRFCSKIHIVSQYSVSLRCSRFCYITYVHPLYRKLEYIESYSCIPPVFLKNVGNFVHRSFKTSFTNFLSFVVRCCVIHIPTDLQCVSAKCNKFNNK